MFRVIPSTAPVDFQPEDLLEITVDASGVSIDLFALYNERNRTYVGGVDIGKRTKLKYGCFIPLYER